jgi:Tfp pilus assembly protein PilW
MNMPHITHRRGSLPAPQSQSGFNFVELMVSMALGLLLIVAMAQVLTSISRSNSEMARMNLQIENGRFAMQMLEGEIKHAGFWGSYVPDFDNLTTTTAPVAASALPVGGSLPDAIPDPCLAYSVANWTAAYKSNLIGIAVQPVPSGNCTTVLANQKAYTESIVVRHAANCLAGSNTSISDCETANASKLYFQASLCAATAQTGSISTTLKLAASSSATDDTYNGPVRIISGTGSGQARTITAYNGSTKVATVTPVWTTIPDLSSTYTFDATDYLLDTYGAGTTLSLHQRNCSSAATLAVAPKAGIRKFLSTIFYIRDYAVTVGDGIPTLVRSKFDLVGATLKHPTTPAEGVEALVEGIEGFRIEYGIDYLSDSGVDVINDASPANRYTAAVLWGAVNPASAINRGDGFPDTYVTCPPATVAAVNVTGANIPLANVCTVAQLTNVVTVKLYVLARSRDKSPGYTDSKTYKLGSATLGPFNDGYKRHVFSTTVRLTNVSGRRETPP